MGLATAAWVIGHEVRLSTVEGNRFTTKDAMQMEARLKRELPPVWLREAIQEIKTDIKSIETRIHKLEVK